EAVGRLALGYLDRERNYLAGSVTAISEGSGALETVAAGLVLNGEGARLAAERLLMERSAGRETVELTLPPSRLALQVGDAIAVAGEMFEVVEIRDGLARRVVARAVLPEVEVTVTAERPPSAVDRPQPRAVPVVTAVHLPPVPGDPGTTRLAIGAFARPWPGEVSVTDADTGAALARVSARGTLGVLTAPLAAGTMFGWDRANAVEVEVLSGHFAPREAADVLAGANRVAVETDSGAWEIVGFAEAELTAPRRYRLTQLLRGQGGTDSAIGAASAGNRVLLLDSRVAVERVDPAWLGSTAELLCFAGLTDPTGVATEAVIGLAPVLPLRPVHLQAVAAGGDIALSWIRRSRADTDSWATEDAPLDWVPEAYRVEIRDGPTTVRTIDSATPAFTYTAAQQAADFGGPATAFSFRVAQVSAVHGPGHWATGEWNG
ncbi:MAG TPA: phage tail protein, partial [Devosia sp.]|nr:phage tail protein [Devosia sp.]